MGFNKISGILLLLFFMSINTSAQWRLINPYPTFNDLYSIYPYSNSTVWIVGENSTVLKTIDTGKTWQVLNIAPGRILKNICFSDSLTGWIVGAKGLILKSSNSGNNWFTYSDSVYPNLNNI